MVCIIDKYKEIYGNFRVAQGEQLQNSEFYNSNLKESKLKMYKATFQMMLLYGLLEKENIILAKKLGEVQEKVINVHKQLEEVLGKNIKIKNSDIVKGINIS